MPISFKSVALFGRRHREKQIRSTLAQLETLLKKTGVNAVIESETAKLLAGHSLPTVNEAQLKDHCDLIIVVGGDGSLLSAARAAAEQNLPVLGINRGRLGFLTDIRPDQLNLVADVLHGAYQEEQRFLLQASVERDGKVLHQLTALNDAVLLPGDVAHMIEFSIYIDQQLVCLQRADGLIVATPTGSTAYALSGGGPILHPQLDAIVLVPMFPHKLTSRPIVVSAASTITITVNKHNDISPRISCDGQERLMLLPGDNIIIRRKPERLCLIHPLGYQYFATLRDKLQWEYTHSDWIFRAAQIPASHRS